MPKSTPVIFKKSLLAVAVLSVSACSSMPQGSGIDLESVGDGIVRAGKATADVSRKTWNTTAYLLGFTDSKEDNDGAGIVSEDPVLADDVLADGDVAQVLPLEEAPVVEAVPLTSAKIDDMVDEDAPVLVQQATAPSAEALAPVNASQGDIADIAIEESAQSITPVAVATVESTNGDFLAEEDLIHEVAANENLWDIAKKTTGDANNWHVLADVNNLTQSAMVFPGQQLIIPSAMAKPDYDLPVASAESAQEPAVLIDTQNIDAAIEEGPGESERLAMPSDTDNAALASAQPAQSDDQQAAETLLAEAISENAIALDLNEGETLWDFAKRTTGNALNWQAIADQNNFTEKQAVTVRPGQTIFVPQSLLRPESDPTTSAEASTSDVLTPVADVVETTAIEAVETATATEAELPTAAEVQTATATLQEAPKEVEQTIAAALPAAPDVQNVLVDNTEVMVTDAPNDETTQPITIVEATYKADDGLAPVTAEQAPAPMVEDDNIPAKVVVSGTYYPKAVYNNADFSSSLLMRVSPGTTLQVSRAMGTWFEVETDKGVGFVHQRDIK